MKRIGTIFQVKFFLLYLLKYSIQKKRKNKKNFKKTIDKYIEICYNKDTEREVDKYEEQRTAKPNQQGNG